MGLLTILIERGELKMNNKDLVDRANYIFFDFFDTIVHRKVDEQYLLEQWANSLSIQLNYAVQPEMLYRGRKKATKIVLKKNKTEEPDYYSIIKELYGLFHCSLYNVKFTDFFEISEKIELELEKSILFLDEDCKKIIEYALKIDKKILFHVTLTPYKKDIEPNILPKGKIIEAIKKLSSIIGIDNLQVRYDPIFISEKYNLEYHIKAFDNLCTLLKGYVNKIIVSFLDNYKNVRKNMKTINYKPLTEYDYEMIGKNFSKSAKKNGMIVQTCFEDRNLVEYGFTKGECISHELAYKLTGKTYKNWTARKEKKCNCVKMVDIGAYNTCKHFCKYCYANYDENQVIENYKLHDPNSSLLVGNLKKDDIIKIRIV